MHAATHALSTQVCPAPQPMVPAHTRQAPLMQSASSHWAVSTHSVPAHCCWVHVAVSTALHWAGTHGLQAVSCVLQPKSHWVASHGVPQPSLLHG